MSMSDIAIVILNYNGSVFLQRFLPNVLKYSPGAEVIIADNASDDDSKVWIEANYPKEVHWIQLKENYGFCGGYNAALKQLKHKYFVLLNSDVEVSEGWLEPMYSLLEKNPHIGACQPKIKMQADKRYFEYAGAAGGYIDRLGYPFCRGRIFDEVEQDLGQYDDERPVFWATGACMMIRSALYQELGGLDERFFAHMEEIDLCWRLQRAGYEVWYTGKSEVYHVGGGTLPYNNPRKTYYNFRNSLMMLYKNQPASSLLLIIFARLVLDGVAALKFALDGEPKHIGAILAAHFSFYRHIPGLQATRNAFSKHSSKKNNKVTLQGKWKGLLVFSFFLKAKKTFPELIKESTAAASETNRQYNEI
ncbi:glycosyltransferase family 2 protein [Algivirga pacifica]|uniref:Glycosyltransferase family 2 protein n=1 Tax=Algivirga pacifica TaxID=1162670 RepID=A0ABP9DAN7_9BACT